MTDRTTRFRVLVVDNDATVHEKAVGRLHQLDPDIEVRSATTVAEATALAEAEFFHLAFVDLKLGRHSGTAVMRHLNVFSPACQIFVMTRHLTDYAGEVLALLSPEFSFAGLVDKVVGDVDWFRPFVEPVFKQWRQRLLDVEGLDDVVQAVRAKAYRTNKQLATAGLSLVQLRKDGAALADEIEWLLMGLFGAIGEPVTGSRSLVTLRLLERGYSSSVVAEALPSLRFASLDDTVQGNRCVVKIGAKTEIRGEAERYEQIVKHGVALEHRVELLGYVTGDALAAVCYSFAGGNALGIKTLDELLAEKTHHSWRDVIREIFAADASNWYSIKSEVGALRTYFTSELGIALDRCFDSFEKWIDRLAQEEVVRRDKQRLRIGNDIVITLPTKAMLAASGLTSATPACLVHGDLHGGNVLVDNKGRAYFIDFRNAGVGPRLIDLSALQTTARFSHVETFRHPVRGWSAHYDPTLVEAIATSVHQEEKVIGNSYPEGEHWSEVVAELDRARLANFPQSDRTEALWTNFAYCLSMYRIEYMEWHRKLRLLTWLSAMTVALNRSS